MTKATQYREAYITMSPQTVADYMSLLLTIDPNSNMVNRDGKIWIEFSDGSEWQLGSAEASATTMNHHDA